MAVFGIKKFVLFTGSLLSLDRNMAVQCTILKGNYSAILASWTMWRMVVRELQTVQSLESVCMHSEDSIMVFCDVVPCSFIYRYKCCGGICHLGIFCHGNGNIRFFQNVGMSLPYYIVSYPRGHKLNFHSCESLSFHIENFFTEI